MADHTKRPAYSDCVSAPTMLLGQQTLTMQTVETLLASEDDDSVTDQRCSHSSDPRNLTTNQMNVMNQDNDTPTQSNGKSQYLCEPYFNSVMGGKDIRVLFAMTIGADESQKKLPKHTEAPFCHAKTYYKEVKPDLGTLQQEVIRRFKAYGFKGREPRPSNWSKDKCKEYLQSNPIPFDKKMRRSTFMRSC